MKRFVHVIAAAGAALLLTGCEVGMKEWTQTGYRGAALEQITDVSSKVKQGAIPPTPYPLDASMREGERANVTYQNVQVLGDLSTEEFNHLMASMNTWIAPGDGETQGCNYCHNPENMASDEKYTKIVARKMIQMTRNINANWTSHVQQTGVTCWTCHRGNAVPVNNWSNVSNGKPGLRGNKFGQNTPDPTVGYASLPTGMFANYLQGTQNIRVASDKALASPDHVVSIKNTEQTYGLMMHLSQSLGVNCTYCHNSQSFRAWNLSRAQRNTAWYGIRMVRDANDEYIETLTNVFPANRKGPAGDPLKVNCATCHQGQAKPLGGVSMLPEHPQLRGPVGAVTAAATPPDANATTEAFNKPATMATAGPASNTAAAGDAGMKDAEK
ncbi:photosynthetic reaction center cytochrome PufC [Glacieibacterium frigidum]|nr:photosynthetic reaction center cytochrome PufC [Glacieibacterium frigidum]